MPPNKPVNLQRDQTYDTRNIKRRTKTKIFFNKIYRRKNRKDFFIKWQAIMEAIADAKEMIPNKEKKLIHQISRGFHMLQQLPTLFTFEKFFSLLHALSYISQNMQPKSLINELLDEFTRWLDMHSCCNMPLETMAKIVKTVSRFNPDFLGRKTHLINTLLLKIESVINNKNLPYDSNQYISLFALFLQLPIDFYAHSRLLLSICLKCINLEIEADRLDYEPPQLIQMWKMSAFVHTVFPNNKKYEDFFLILDELLSDPEQLPPTPSDLQMKVTHKIAKFLGPNIGKELKIEHQAGCFSLDIALPNKKINIEVDGTQHRAIKKPRQADVFRDYILEKLLGWQVIRIPAFKYYKEMQANCDQYLNTLFANFPDLLQDNKILEQKESIKQQIKSKEYIPKENCIFNNPKTSKHVIKVSGLREEKCLLSDTFISPKNNTQIFTRHYPKKSTVIIRALITQTPSIQQKTTDEFASTFYTKNTQITPCFLSDYIAIILSKNMTALQEAIKYGDMDATKSLLQNNPIFYSHFAAQSILKFTKKNQNKLILMMLKNLIQNPASPQPAFFTAKQPEPEKKRTAHKPQKKPKPKKPKKRKNKSKPCQPN